LLGIDGEVFKLVYTTFTGLLLLVFTVVNYHPPFSSLCFKTLVK